MSLFSGQSARFQRFRGTREPAVSVRPCWKTPEIQTEVHHESNSSSKVCPVVEDEMDEENMDRRRVEQ